MAKASKRPPNIAKPYHTGRAISGLAARRGWHVLVLSLLSVVFYLFAGQLLVSLRGFWQVLANIAVLLAVGGCLFADGIGAGQDDVAFGEIVYTRIESGRTPSSLDEARCYHHLKGWFTAFVGVLPLLLPALLFAVIATKQVYHLGALPSWVATIERHQEVGLALQYYHQAQPVTTEGVLRVVIRLLLFPYVALFGPDDAGRMLLMERLSPLLICIIPSFYSVGYLFGPAARARVHADIALGKKRQAARERKNRQKRIEQKDRIV